MFLVIGFSMVASRNEFGFGIVIFKIEQSNVCVFLHLFARIYASLTVKRQPQHSFSGNPSSFFA